MPLLFHVPLSASPPSLCIHLIFCAFNFGSVLSLHLSALILVSLLSPPSLCCHHLHIFLCLLESSNLHDLTCSIPTSTPITYCQHFHVISMATILFTPSLYFYATPHSSGFPLSPFLSSLRYSSLSSTLSMPSLSPTFLPLHYYSIPSYC